MVVRPGHSRVWERRGNLRGHRTPRRNQRDQFTTLFHECIDHRNDNFALQSLAQLDDGIHGTVPRRRDDHDVAGGGRSVVAVTEQTGEVDECRAHSGTTPIDLLQRTMALDEACALVHATQATAAELQAIRDYDREGFWTK